MEERLQLAVFIDFDNIEIGVKTTLSTELDLSLVLEALKERGEVVSKSAYGDWARAGTHSRTLTDHAVHMVQRNVTPRGDKNGADINLVVDALEMAFTRPHINAFAIVGGDSDFIALVEKLKQFGKRVLVVGGRSFTSGILQRNCHEFISYENLLAASRGSRGLQSQSRGGAGRLSFEQGFQRLQRALKILSDRGVEPQLGPIKSTLLQLDSTFSERDYGASSFREFIQRLDDQGYLHLRRIDQGYLVELNGDGGREPAAKSPRRPAARAAAASSAEGASAEAPPEEDTAPTAAPAVDANGDGEAPPAAVRRPEDAMSLLRSVVDKLFESRAGKPMYVRHLAQGLRAADPDFDEQAYGFRTLTELVHMGQREGIVRMQRDRQGAWRISSAVTEPPAGAGSFVDGGIAAPGAPADDTRADLGEGESPSGQEEGAEMAPIGAGSASSHAYASAETSTAGEPSAGTEESSPGPGTSAGASGEGDPDAADDAKPKRSRRRRSSGSGSSARAPRVAKPAKAAAKPTEARPSRRRKAVDTPSED